MANVIKEIDWNGKHYTFTNTFRNSGYKSHDILTMTDDRGNSWEGETTWINRPWHRFDLEEAFTEIVGKAFGPKALELIHKINEHAYGVEGAIDEFFATFKPEDIQQASEGEEVADDSTEARIQALADYLEIDPEEIEEIDTNEFDVDGKTYLVLTDDEADEEFDASVRNLWDELGLSGLGDIANTIIENCIDDDQLEDYVRRDIENYVYDSMADEEVVYECIDEGIVDEEDVYNEDEDLRDDIDFDDLRDKLIEEKFDNVDDYVEYLRDMGFEDSFFADYIDDDKAVETIKDSADVNGNGRGQELSYYDGREIDLGNGLYAYRRN